MKTERNYEHQQNQVMEQEGWHYELEDKNEPLTYKGVVFNEMKGVYSSPDSLHGRTCQQVRFLTVHNQLRFLFFFRRVFFFLASLSA